MILYFEIENIEEYTNTYYRILVYSIDTLVYYLHGFT